MRKSLVATVAGAALIACGGLAAAQQRMEGSPSGANGAQGSSQGEPGGAVHKRQSGGVQNPAQGMQGPAQGRSGAIEENKHRTRHSGTMQGQAQALSGTIEENEHRTRHSGATQGQGQGRSGAIGENEHRTRHSGTQTQGRSGAVEENERRSGGAVQGSAQERSGRSVGSATLSPDQKTRLHGIITGGNVRRIDEVDFALAVGTRVPNTVTFYDVPDTIVDILPQYRGFEYIIVRDDLVIIDPETLEIVAVLPV
jgi:Protein of unknown function (DUF1236)